VVLALDAPNAVYIFVAPGRDSPPRFALFPHRRVPFCDEGDAVLPEGHPPLGNLHEFFGSTDDGSPYAKPRIDLFN
jgi:hypothetical protein